MKKQFISFIKKEIKHIFRDKRTLIIMFIVPIVLLLILSYAISTELKNIPFIIFDQSKTTLSKELTQKIINNPYFEYVGDINSDSEVDKILKKGKCKLIIVIPQAFENDLYKTEYSRLQLIIDASDPGVATTINQYVQLVIHQFEEQFSKQFKSKYVINTQIKLQYNPQAKSTYNFVPGLIGSILLLICTMMTSIAIVKEKETGTMELLLVSPLKPQIVVLAKAIPYFIISALDVVVILLISYFLLKIPIHGNLILVFSLCLIFILCALSLGLLISSVAETQETAIISSMLGLMLPSMILSGFIFPLESIPYILQFFSNFIPSKWFVQAFKKVMIKGSGFHLVIKEISVLLLMTSTLFFISIKLFKQRL